MKSKSLHFIEPLKFLPNVRNVLFQLPPKRKIELCIQLILTLLSFCFPKTRRIFQLTFYYWEYWKVEIQEKRKEGELTSLMEKRLHSSMQSLENHVIALPLAIIQGTDFSSPRIIKVSSVFLDIDITNHNTIIGAYSIYLLTLFREHLYSESHDTDKILQSGLVNVYHTYAIWGMDFL